MTKPNDPAINDLDYMSSGGHIHDQCYKNLTKREYFAAMAMSGLCGSPLIMGGEKLGDDGITFHFSGLALKMADALIAELNK